jgi:zinc transport system ATP-binding protein
MLEVSNLNVKIDNEEIIKNISFNLAPGEILTILGPNGAGKTVLLKTLLGLLPYEGKIKWSKKYKIGYLPQGLNQLFFKNLPLTVLDFFNFKNEKLNKDKIIKYLFFVGLNQNILKKNIGNLSSGEFQRVLMAWVLIDEPEVLFLDEPTTGLDLGGGETIYSLLKKIQEEKNLTIILVTHDLNVVYSFSNKVLCLSKKGKICFGAPEEVINPETLKEMFGGEIKFYKH